ncbi:MAG: HAD-IA family hydrolase [Bacteroidota bacterium]
MTAILFDVDGVLIHGYHAKPAFRKCWDEYLEADLQIKREDFKRVFIRDAFKREVLTGQKLLYEALQEVLPQIGYHDDPQMLIDYWMERDADVNHELIEYVERFTQHPEVTLYIASNQEHVRASYLMEEVGFKKYFKDIFYAARLGTLKPAAPFFEEIERLLSVPKEDIIFFDDSQEVVNAATEFGWEAHQFDTVEDLFNSDKVQSLLL